MRRIRSIKPEILEDEKTAGLSDTALRIYVSTFVLADDHGNLRASSKFIEKQVFWSRDPAVPFPVAWAELTSCGLIREYVVDGQRYAHIRNWDKHQKIDHPSKPKVPLPPEESGQHTQCVPDSRDSRETLASPRETLETDLDQEGKGKDRKGEREREAGASPADSGSALAADLSEETSDEPRGGQRSNATGSPSDDREPCATHLATDPHKPFLGHPDASEPAQRSLLTTDATPTNTTAPSRQKAGKGAKVTAEEQEVYEHWIACWKRDVKGSRIPNLSPKRLGKIRERLKDGYGVNDLKTAIDGAFASPFHSGIRPDGEQGQRFQDLELICRSAEKTDAFLALAEKLLPKRRPAAPAAPRKEPSGPSGTPLHQAPVLSLLSALESYEEDPIGEFCARYGNQTEEAS